MAPSDPETVVDAFLVVAELYDVDPERLEETLSGEFGEPDLESVRTKPGTADDDTRDAEGELKGSVGQKSRNSDLSINGLLRAHGDAVNGGEGA